MASSLVEDTLRAKLIEARAPPLPCRRVLAQLVGERARTAGPVRCPGADAGALGAQAGERERLKVLLKERLLECGWRDAVKEEVRDARPPPPPGQCGSRV